MGKLNRGDKKEGMIFWAYAASCKNGEYWVTPQMFHKKKSKKQKPRPKLQSIETNKKRRLKYAADPNLRQKLKIENEARYERLKKTGEIKRIRSLHHEKRMKNPIYYLQKVCRSRLWVALKGIGKKPSRTEMMIGCSFEDLKKHMESLFNDGMSWDNKGKWHIDHIIPLSSAKTISEVISLCHFTNLQPLWAKDNLRKGKK